MLTAPAAVASPSVIADDTFERTSASGWGTATTGGTYRGSFSDGAMSVDAGVGVISLGPGESGSVLLGTGQAGDVRSDATLRLTDLSGSAYYATVLRYQPDGSQYRARLQLNSAGVPVLAVSRLNGRTETPIAAKKVGASIADGSWYTLSFTITGTDPVAIQASLIKDGEPTVEPQLNVVDAAEGRITADGRIGWWGYASRGATGETALELEALTITAGAPALTTLPPSVPAPGPIPAPTPTPGPSAAPTPTPTAEPTPAPEPTDEPTPEPTAAPEPEAPVVTAGRGSAAVGTAAYPVPAGAIFVKNTSPTKIQNGAIGTPYTSVQAAVNAAKAGSTIVIRGGTYNESVSIPFGKGITIQAYPKEAVWFDGSVPVTSWTASGAVWTSANWTSRFANDMGGAASRFVDANGPMANHPDQLFINGISQKQVATAAQVTAGTFAVDYSGKRLIIGTNPAGKSVRASNLSQAFDVLAANTTLQGFGVTRYATTYGGSAAVRMQNTFATVRDLVITDNALIGLSVNNNDSLAERITSQRNGMMGIGANAAYRFVLRDSDATNNNVEKFKVSPVAGGIKITRSRDVTVDNVDSSRNYGSGIWFDESTYDMKVTNVTSNHNTTTGIQLELSAKAILAGNQTIGGGTGVIIMNTSDVQIFNSDFGGGKNNGISLKQDSRRPATASTGWDPRVGKSDPTMSWVTKNITISNNVFQAPGENSVRAIDASTNRAVDTWNVKITGNLFNNKAAGGPTMVAWGKGDNKSFEVFNTPDALAAAKGSTWRNAMTGSVKTLAQMAPEIAANVGVAVSLPTDIASVLGVAPGTKHLGSGL